MNSLFRPYLQNISRLIRYQKFNPAIFLLLIICISDLNAKEIPVALTHIDTISVYCQKIKSDNIEVDFLNEKGVLLLSTAIWIPRSINGPEKALQYTKELKACLDAKIKGSNNIIIVRGKSDIDKVISEKKVGLIMTLEGGEPLEDIKNIESINELGIKAVSLTWSRDNSLACAHNTKNDTGLSDKGKEIVRLLNKHKIMIDVSHASDKTIEDILFTSEAPVYASHSNARSICKSDRNLTDEQIKKIAKGGGIIGINFHSPHLSCKSESSVDDIYKHIAYIRKIAGVKSIAIGSDFDGHIKTPSDIKGLKDISAIIRKLRSENWTEEEIKDILYLNFVRFFERINNE